MRVPGKAHLYRSAIRWQRFAHWLFDLDRKPALFVCWSLFAAFSALDFVTPPQLNLTFLYVFVVIIACWNAGLGWGLSFAMMAFVMQVISFSEIQSPYITPIYLLIILGNRLFTFLVVVALTVPLKKMYEREQLTARVDFLTGAPNRKAFFDMLAIELARNQRTGLPFAVAYLDLDNFKQVNDESGHDEGDALLRAAAAAIKSALRSTDTLARIGGDEFAILLPDANQATSAQVLERVKETLDACMEGHAWQVTASIGLGTFNRPQLTADGLMTACDALMYRVKHSGKSAIASEHFGTGQA